MARPPKPISEKEVSNYARLGASNVDIAEMVGVDEKTIRNRFSEILAKSRAKRRTVIRGWQFDAAKNGNVTMLIWLGKQELGQSDKQEHSGESTVIIREGKRIDTSPRT